METKQSTEYVVSVAASRAYFGSATIEAESLDDAIRVARQESASEWRARDLGLEPAFGEPFQDYRIVKVEADDGSEEWCPDDEPEIREGLRYSCFVLDDHSTWEQPTYLADRNMTEAEFSERVLAQSSRGCFLVVGIQEDPDCPDESLEWLK